MDIEDYKKIILEYETKSNKDLVIVMEHINEEFEKTKQQVINMTYYFLHQHEAVSTSLTLFPNLSYYLFLFFLITKRFNQSTPLLRADWWGNRTQERETEREI